MSAPDNARVLYVDDERDARNVFRTALHRAGIDADLAGSGIEALRMLREQHYDVVASDYHMPGLDGLGLIERAHALDASTSFVLVTGGGGPSFEADSEAQRAITAIVRKPWSPAELVQCVKNAIDVATGRRRLRVARPAGAESTRVLLIEDSRSDATLVARALDRAQRGYSVVHCATLGDALRALHDDVFDLVLTDLSLPDARGLDTVTMLQRAAPDLPMVVLSGYGDEAVAMQAVRLGAQDYLLKRGIDPQAIHRCLGYARERKRTERRLRDLAHFDPLTGLANRLLFRDRADQALARTGREATTHAVMLLDLDRFKLVNDSLGHDAGDSLLVAVAERLGAVARKSDTVARLGGDEFAVFLDGASNEAATSVAERVLIALAQPVPVGGRELVVTTSIGIAMSPSNGATVQELLKSADAAMYRAKSRGRNNYQFFDRELHAQAVTRLELEHDLRLAISGGELELYYQPQLCMRSGAVPSLEALLRWNHPRRGVVSPADFVPVLEESGLIVPAGAWVLRAACRQLAAWRARGQEELRVSVNVSARQLDDPDFGKLVETALREAELPGDALELEITETALIEDVPRVVGLLDTLSQLGVRFAIDDFGIGYSSLSQLSELPIDVLKIDRSFVERMHTPRGGALVRAVVDLGHVLGYEVVAEGVEVRHQWDTLAGLGCHIAQGYLMGRPMTWQALEAWFAAQRELEGVEVGIHAH